MADDKNQIHSVQNNAASDSLPSSVHHEGINTDKLDKEAGPIPSSYEDDEIYMNLSFATELPDLIGQDAFSAIQTEHRMSFRRGLQLYPKAIAWSACISLAIVMEGYDTALVSTLYAFSEFQRSYGIPSPNGGHQIAPKWQSSLSNGSTSGSIIGLIANGIIAQRLGYRYTLMGALFLLTAFIFLSFFASNIETLLASQILCGLSWGVLSTLTTTYAAEVMPLNLRAYLTSIINMCWLFGQIVAYGVLRGFIDWDSTWSYRIPFGIQWAWILIVLVLAFFAPESPWWLIQHGRTKEAERALQRLTRRNLGFSVPNTIAIMQQTNNIEKRFTEDAASKRKQTGWSLHNLPYVECFRGSNLRRTEIACMIFISQNLCGLPIIGYAAYLFTQVGFDERHSFDINLGMQGVAIVGGILSLVLMKHLGRRTIYLTGLTLCFLILITAGTIGCFPEKSGTLWATAGLLILFIFVFDLTVGPITYCLVAEIPSTRLRIKTVVLARIAYNVSGIITNILIQRMLNPTAWNWRAKSCFFVAGTCGSCLIYCYFRLPETRGLGYHELDILFENRADARKFGALQKTLEQNNYFSFRKDENDEGGGGGGRRRSFVLLWH